MLISRGQEIAGVDAVTVRRWLRCLVSAPQTSGAFAADIGVSRSEADDILWRLADEMLVRQLGPHEDSGIGYGHIDDPSGAPHWVTTVKGNAIAKARIGRPIARSRADELLAQLLQRVSEYNADEGRFFDIEWVEVFGSYQRGDDHLGDVDLRALAVRRFDWNEHERRRVEALTRSQVAVGRRLIDQVNWPFKQMERFIRGRSPAIDLQLDQERSEPLPKGSATTALYERTPGCRQDWPAAIRT